MLRALRSFRLKPPPVRSGIRSASRDDWTWVAIDAGRTLRPGMFVARVAGRPMEPAIPDGARCLFATPVTGTRQGRTVLVQLRDVVDPETGARYTLKRYESEKTRDGDSWRHATIRLKPLNADFEPIILTGTDEHHLRVVAERVRYPSRPESEALSARGRIRVWLT